MCLPVVKEIIRNELGETLRPITNKFQSRKLFYKHPLAIICFYIHFSVMNKYLVLVNGFL